MFVKLMYSSSWRKLTLLASHNLCSEGTIKIFQLPLHTHKPPLQHDTKLELILKANVHTFTIYNKWQFMQYKIHGFHVLIK